MISGEDSARQTLQTDVSDVDSQTATIWREGFPSRHSVSPWSKSQPVVRELEASY